MMRLSWQAYALEIASAAALRSEDPWVKVGTCVLRKDHTVASTGYNGAPSGMDLDWSDRKLRRLFVIHAEMNALARTTPTKVAGGLLATTFHPCAACLPTIAAYGIKEIVYQRELSPETYDRAEQDFIAVTLDLHVVQLEVSSTERVDEV
jgi:dCMP deaminase